MCKHEEKKCPRCAVIFECKVGSIMQCQCSTVHLSLEEHIYVDQKYTDCLCASCLEAIKQEYQLFKTKTFF